MPGSSHGGRGRGSGPESEEWFAGDLAILGRGACRARQADAGAFCNVDELLQQKRRLLNTWSTLRLALGSWRPDSPETRCRDRLTLEQRAQFDRDEASFRAWYDEGTPFCFASAEIAAGQDHDARANAWHDVIERTCGPLRTLPPVEPHEAEPTIPKWIPVALVLGLAAYLLTSTGAGAALKRRIAK